MPAPLASIGRLVDAASRGPESVVRAAGLLPRVTQLLDAVERLLARADDVVTRLDATAHHLDAVIGRAEALIVPLDPALGEALGTVAALDSVAPDLTELLVVSRALNELMGSLPGLGRAKKRVDEELAREQEQGRPAPS